MTLEELSIFINQFDDYDVRTHKNVRFVDQKCTPDIVCFIADCILNTECAKNEFSKYQLWHTSFFIENTRVLFGKPYGNDKKAKKEYDKVSGQPLALLAYAHILNRRMVGNKWRYSVNNLDALEYIARREFNAYNFLFLFFKKVVSESGILRLFDEYKELLKNDVRLAHKTLYSKYRAFVKANSNIKGDSEPDRMLHKVLNVFALKEQIPGSDLEIPTWQDLMYNRENWKDIGRNKDKRITRKEAAEKAKEENQENFFIEYQVKKAIDNLKKYQGDRSEIIDELATGTANEVHHIFPKPRFPVLATYYENLILLTSSQHRQKAHPNGNTQIINPDYQYVCLMAKSKTVEKSLIQGSDFYSKKDFVFVVNTGLQTEGIFVLPEDSSFEQIRKFIIDFYNH